VGKPVDKLWRSGVHAVQPAQHKMLCVAGEIRLTARRFQALVYDLAPIFQAIDFKQFAAPQPVLGPDQNCC
jgi:hypothetical protein